MKGMFWYSNDLRKAAHTLSDIKRKIRWQYKNTADENIIKTAKDEQLHAIKELRQHLKFHFQKGFKFCFDNMYFLRFPTIYIYISIFSF